METEIPDLNIPEDAAAIVIYANGGVAVHLPKAGSDDDVAPDNTVAISAFTYLMTRNRKLFERVLDAFEADVAFVTKDFPE